MSQYVRSIAVKRTFQGDKVVLTLKPIKFIDAVKFRNIDTDALKEEEVQPIIDILKAYASGLTGLRAEDGEEVSLDEFFSLAFFSELMLDMLSEWIAGGLPKNPS